ncbi:hypothetical protein COI99_14670 [Bacillus cereus]|nr:hypothetical protein COI99_14670 [Bacillus cereus]
MKVIFKREGGGKFFESANENISILLDVLKETKGIKIGMIEYEVLEFKLEYYRNPKKTETERELHIIMKPKLNQ